MKILKALGVCFLSFCLIFLLLVVISHNIDRSIEVEQGEIFT